VTVIRRVKSSTPLRRKRYFVAAIGLLWTSHAMADAAQLPPMYLEVGYQTGGTRVEGGAADDSTYGPNAAAVFPLLPYLSAVVSAAYTRTAVKRALVTGASATSMSRCDVYNRDWSAGLTVRDQTIGKIGVSYGSDAASSSCAEALVGASTDSVETARRAAAAEYYFSRVTIGAVLTHARVGGDRDLDSSRFVVTWYPTPNLSLATSAEDLGGVNVYGLGLGYRPEFVDGAIRLSVDYKVQHQPVNVGVITFGFTFYFDEHLDLIARDRQYR
jgi:hypothetical protein